MENSITINELHLCYTISPDGKELIKYHWHNGDIIELPASIESIGPFALTNMKHIKTVILPIGLNSIGKGAFCECSSLQSIVFLGSDHKLAIDKQAFWKCFSLENINLPQKTTVISDRCFEDCRNLQTLILPDGVKSIGDFAFKGCDRLTTIFIGNDTEHISKSAFDFACSLSAILVHKDNSHFSTYYGILIRGQNLFRIPEAFNCNSNSPKKLNNVLKEALSKCSSIDEGAFRNTNIKYSLIPNNINRIGYEAFEGCKNLQEIHFQNQSKITHIGMRTFANCTNLKLIVIPAGVGIIGYKAFENCTSIKAIYLPSSVWRIHMEAFSNCNALKMIFFSPVKRGYRHIEKGSQIILPNKNCKIIVPLEEKDFFEEVFAKNTENFLLKK